VSAKKIAKKKAKPAAKKRAKPVPKEMAGPGRKERLPRKEEVRGYTPGLPDLQKWPDIAIELKGFTGGKTPCHSVVCERACFAFLPTSIIR